MPEFVVTSRSLIDREKAAPFRELHLTYMSMLKGEGKLKVAGRFADGRGGMYVLIADSLPSALELANGDPYHSNRVRDYELREWEQRF
jgi:uncharacterized protein YciI